jgi:hypothetical protein
MPPRQRLRYTTWSKFDRVFSNGNTETRYIRASIFGQWWAIRYYHITTDVEEQPPESTWLIRTNLDDQENGGQHLRTTHLDRIGL